MVEIIPLWLVNLLSFATVFAVMTSIGTTITPREFFQHIRAPSLLFRSLVGVLVVVPVVGFATGFAFGLSLAEKVGVALMAIAPGAPLALRRALSSGADAYFAPVLQVTVAILAVPSLPLWVFIGNWIFGTHGYVDVIAAAQQVSLAQLLPIAFGAAIKRIAPRAADRIGTAVGRAGGVLLLAAIVSQVIDLHLIILSARLWPMAAAAVTTLAAILAGHVLAGPSPAAQRAAAIAGGLRNVGLALLVAAANRVPPVVQEVIVSYWIAAFISVSGYVLLRRRTVK